MKAQTPHARPIYEALLLKTIANVCVSYVYTCVRLQGEFTDVDLLVLYSAHPSVYNVVYLSHAI